MTERCKRRSKRVFQSAIAKIEGPNGWKSTLCSLWNISEHGALIELPPDYTFPATFRFKLIANQKSHDAQVVWRNDTFAGLPPASRPVRR